MSNQERIKELEARVIEVEEERDQLKESVKWWEQVVNRCEQDKEDLYARMRHARLLLEVEEG